MRSLSHTVTPEQDQRTVKSIALKVLRVSRGQFSHLKFSGGVLVDGLPARADQRLRPGQTLTLTLRDEDRADRRLPACDLPIRIVYEDEDYWIIHKPAPLPTLRSAHQTGPTLEGALYAHLHAPKDFVFRPVNRLDKGTSGLMAAAKNAHAQQLLQKQLHTPAFVREYRAVCRGRLPAGEGVIDLPIGKAGTGVKRAVLPDGKPATTQYRVEKEAAGLSLVRLCLTTGRTHQIRVHLAAVGCPIVGDYLYGESDPRLPGRFALHAAYMQFTHPLTGRVIRAEAPLPPEIAALLPEEEG
ncbi:MAG: RluA family pseudouridine synthase [Clostridia bacterium]|nr:RluA family pseudouridine synthase [Clostridia bacterium]